jgi:hypothetical protein
LTLEGTSKDSVWIEQEKWGYPAFDIHSIDSCSVRKVSIISKQKRIYPNGFFDRGTDRYVTNAGIYSDSHHGSFEDLRIKGFTCGIFLSSWNGKGLYEQKRNNRVREVVVDSVDFGLLLTGQKNLSVSRLSGSFLRQENSGGAPHLIYISDAVDPAHVWTEDFEIRDCLALNSSGGHAYQMGSVRNGSIIDLKADRCTGILAVVNFVNITIDTLVALRDQTHPVGSVFIQPVNVRGIKMNYVSIESENPQALLMLLDGEDNEYSDIILKGAIREVSDKYLVVFKGKNSEIHGIRYESPVEEAGAVIVLMEGTNMFMENITCAGCRAAFNVHQSCLQCIVELDSREIVPAKGYSDFLLYIDPFKLAKVKDKAKVNN